MGRGAWQRAVQCALAHGSGGIGEGQGCFDPWSFGQADRLIIHLFVDAIKSALFNAKDAGLYFWVRILMSEEVFIRVIFWRTFGEAYFEEDQKHGRVCSGEWHFAPHAVQIFQRSGERASINAGKSRVGADAI